MAVIGAVQGDIHDIGKNLVKMMLEVNGIEVHDLGRDVEMEKFIDEGQEVDADLLCLSALMTTTIIAIKDYMPEFKAKLPAHQDHDRRGAAQPAPGRRVGRRRLRRERHGSGPGGRPAAGAE